jgi:carbon storage regulator
MLVVTRKLREGVVIGDDVRVIVLAIEGDRVRLGIEAPQQFGIRRAGFAAGSTQEMGDESGFGDDGGESPDP